MMLNKRYFLLVASLAIFAFGPASAVEAADLKIGVINVARLLDSAPQTKSALQALQDEFAPRERELVAEQQELRTQGEALQRDSAIMSEPERRSSEQSLREKQRELARKTGQFREDANLRRNEELSRLQRLLLDEVNVYATNNGFDLIIGDGVLYARGEVDITDQVLARMEAAYKSGDK
jgi:outer membrane protein